MLFEILSVIFRKSRNNLFLSQSSNIIKQVHVQVVLVLILVFVQVVLVLIPVFVQVA